MAASSAATRCRATNRAQRSPMPARPGLGPPRSSRPARTLSPAKPRIAGSSVVATSTATATVIAAARPISARNGMPTTVSPASATITVRPANTTAEPAVPTARPAARSWVSPVASSWRYRETMNRA